MAALTLLEAAKLRNLDTFRQGVIETIGTHGNLIGQIPFMSIPGASYTFNREGKLPTAAFRGVNESHQSTVGALAPETETLRMFGGNIDVDRFLVETGGEDQRDMQEEMQLKALALEWTAKFFKGDSDDDPREFDGLQKRLTGDQVIAAGSTSGGDALSLDKLDEAIDRTDSPTHIFMNRTMIRRLSSASRNTSVGGFITYDQDEFGNRVSMYNGLPLVAIDEDASRNQILGFDEAAPAGGTAQCTSIYVASVGDGQLMGIQNGIMDVTDLGLLDDGSKYRTTVDWYNSFVLMGDHSATRLRGVTNAAVVA